nr:PREDICTED: toll-like receptor 7 [Latimeria chalumnae]|eukprot:XP_014354501.1 PREDICTED: toll-like receptor 7 [Latimeria chalumnae]
MHHWDRRIVFESSSGKLLHFLFLFSAVSKVFAAIWFPKTLPCDVNVTERSILLDCSERHLTKIPKGIPANATNITLSINHIPNVFKTSFSGLEDLKEIDFRCNCMPVKIGPKDQICTKRLHVQEDSFRSLKSLKSLYLDGNQLSEIPRGLPPNLALLSLEVNNIYSIRSENLSELSNLESLYLGKNCYFRNPCNVSFFIENGAFSNMSNLLILSLKADNLTNVPQNLPPSLRQLYLYNNMIQKINKMDFANLVHLEILDLSGNCPRCYNAPFPCTPCPGQVSIQIHPSAFKELRNLRILRLHSNSLRSVTSEWFHNTPLLQVLELSQNFLAKEIGEAKFLNFLGKLEELDLSFNYALQVYATSLTLSKTFSNLTYLKTLRLRGYVFKELKRDDLQPLFGLRYLEVIDFGTNFIKITNLNFVRDFPALRILYLAENKISPTSSGSMFGSCSISSPSVSHFSPGILGGVHYFKYDEYGRSCKMKDKESESFRLFIDRECSNYGKTLDLSGNNIFFINPEQFQDLTFLACLNLSGNAMSQTLNGSEFQNLPNLKFLDFSNNRLDLLHWTAFQELKKLEVLDISVNKHYFEAEGVTHMLNFTMGLPALKKLKMNQNEISTSTNRKLKSLSLEVLEFKGNRLDILWKDGDNRYLEFFKELSNLTVLDISYNSISFVPPPVFKNMPPNLLELYLNNNGLKSFNWGKLHFLRKLITLDLSNNALKTVPRELSNCTKHLQKLILRNNKIPKLTKNFLRDAYSLRYLDLSENKIQIIEQSSFPEKVLNKMEVLLLNGNQFLCTCDAVSFIWWIQHTTVNIPRLATDVICAGPGVHQGESVISVDLNTCYLDSLALILYSLSASVIIFLLVVTISSHLFFWDVWYSYHFCAAKFKGYHPLVSQSTCYDAYIAYDVKDPDVADWVFKELRIQLEEQGDKYFNLCLEERDWIPGHPIIDNLSQSIQLSRKTVFVLTDRYVRSGSFKMTFYMAHQRLIDEKLDVIVLVFLEKALQKSKYLKLRKRLCSSSVLDWPTNPQAQRYFWQCLKNALATDNRMQYSKLFQETL